MQTVKIQEHGKMVAAGDRDGTLTLIELSESLSKIQHNEKATFSQVGRMRLSTDLDLCPRRALSL